MTDDRTLIQLALKAREKAYVPYSQFAVGAAVLTESGKVYTGCNIENAAYSPSNCAERTAVFKAVSEGERKIIRIAVVAGSAVLEPPLPAYVSPCGVCRQVLSEFGSPDMVILLAKSEDEYRAYTLGDILPLSFTAKDL